MNNKVKIGILIPTRGDRKQFLEFALQQIERQTIKENGNEIVIEIVSDKPLSDKPDITWRYQLGCARLVEQGCDFIVFWEDDDWYRKDYIEWMLNHWIDKGKPELIGLNHTIYYNIFTQQYMKWTHAHASMFSTCISKEGVKKTNWGDPNYSFTDIVLWKQLQGVLFQANPDISCGIKHGIGLCGGGGHREKFDHYQKSDTNYEFLSSVVDEQAMNFYRTLSLRSKYKYKKVLKWGDAPFLSIITRRMVGKRDELFKNHMRSISNLILNYEQIIIEDDKKLGMLAANTSFQFVNDLIDGQYIHLLDDDDFYTNKDFIQEIKKASQGLPDIIFFKMKILTGDGDEIYPKQTSWNSREPKRGQIGGSCFVVRKWVYDKYIHNFAHPSFGDWNFITQVLKDKAVKAKWIDIKMCETGKVSRGQ